MRYSTDIETSLYNLLVGDISVSAHALPSALGENLPHVHITRTGGYTSDMVIEVNAVDFDVYASDSAEAMAEASDLVGWVRDLGGGTVGTTCYESEVTTLPYDNPDPRHPNIGRATFKARLSVRTRRD